MQQTLLPATLQVTGRMVAGAPAASGRVFKAGMWTLQCDLMCMNTFSSEFSVHLVATCVVSL